MIIVTGGAGFIGSALVWQLNQLGRRDVVVVDELGKAEKWQNLAKRQLLTVLGIDQLKAWLPANAGQIDAVFHMGACSSTTETDADYLMSNNVNYSIDLWHYCVENKIPFIYASSAATYGDGAAGYRDDPESLWQLRPLNKYGFSKHLFDQWVIQQKKTPPVWAGLKFFNVYGPQEYHKGSQASVVFHAYPQVKDQGKLRLFKSYRDGYADGEQKRDFVYVKDVVSVMVHLWQQGKHVTPGIYNVGSGQARTFIDLGRAVFSALGKESAEFSWIEMPESLRDQYQYFTEATLENLRAHAGYSQEMTSLEAGVKDYVQNYLVSKDAFF